jgi:hypothetical protein
MQRHRIEISRQAVSIRMRRDASRRPDPLQHRTEIVVVVIEIRIDHEEV